MEFHAAEIARKGDPPVKHENTSLNTKKMLAASLRKLLEKKPFSKITVTEIIADCGLNRKTFYYHFQDIYALLKWMLEQEAINVVKNFNLITDYEKAILFVLDYVEENRPLIRSLYGSVGYNELRNFFYEDFYQIVENLISTAEQQMQLHLDERLQRFLCQFYTGALAGLLLDALQGENKLDRQELVDNLFSIIQPSLITIIQQKGEPS